MKPALVVAALAAVIVGGCQRETPLMVWVDGFQPENVRFEVQDLGPQTAEQLAAVRRQPDVDGALLLPPGTCGGPCRAALISVFVTNRGDHKEPPPVVRLAVPPGKERRMPIAFGGSDVDPGRTGRIRWLVEMHPEEKDLTATLSSSVRFDVTTTTPPPATPPTPPATPPTPPATGPTPTPPATVPTTVPTTG